MGSGPEKARLVQRVHDEQLSNVYMLDAIPVKAAIPSLLAKADVLYIGCNRQPLYRYGISPNKLMDYMMAGRPVIHSVDAGNNPVCEAGCGITIEPESPQAVVDAVNRLFALPDREPGNALGQNGRSFIESSRPIRF